MNPTDFIRRHITASLVAEGFSESVAGGGLSTASLIIGEVHRQAGKGQFLRIVSSAHASGLWGRQLLQSGRQQRKSREEVVALNPACSDFCFAHQIYLAG
ncbi:MULTISPECIES: hypothetical protein [Klebsiella]|uniref:hypothetical protein n=1 Tax=Klebsiella TaxID=570 RepID=UPI0016014232|nr:MULTISPECIES: hypothetical protein [Klebsiella]MBQ4654452.1 hypothetical protein [Klebsiella michiganensis]MBQ4659384.1 hypothetical protein [Klebsiella michiganensis]